MILHKQRGVPLPAVPLPPSTRDWIPCPWVYSIEQSHLHTSRLRVGGGEYRSVHVCGERDLLVQVERLHRWDGSGRCRRKGDRRNAKQRRWIRRLDVSPWTIVNE